MKFKVINGLPFITVSIAYQGAEIEITNVLIDTGSATSIFSADNLMNINLVPDPNDILFTIRGVGGIEAVFSRKVDFIQIGDKRVKDFQIEVGGMDYGFDIKGILGMDLLIESQALIDTSKMEISFG